MISVTHDHPPPGYFQILKGSRNFRFFWFSQIASDIGDWFNLIASASLIGLLTESGLAVGGLFVVRTLAPFIASPIGGVLADKLNRRNIIILANLIRALLMLSFLFVRTASDVWLLYTLTAIQLFISGITYPARTALLPETVSEKGLGTANALSGLSFSLMFAVGSALGGIVSGWIGIYPAYVLNSLMYLISVILIFQVTGASTPHEGTSIKNFGDGLSQYLEGIRYLNKQPYLYAISINKAFIGLLLGSTFEIILVAISGTAFVFGEGGGIGLGLMFAFAGVGLGLGPVIARKITGDHLPYLAYAIIVGYIIGGIGMGLNATLSSWTAILIGNFLRGVGNALVWLFSTQMILVLVPGKVRGRIVATEFAFSMLVSAIGAALVGLALDTSLGISGTAWLMAGLTLIPAVLWSLWIFTTGKSTPIFSPQGANTP